MADNIKSSNMGDQDRIVSGNKLIVEFMGYKTYKGIVWTQPNISTSIEDWAKYHCLWDWQIPVYSKLAKAMKDLIVIADDEIHDRFKRFTERYEHAIYNNDLEAGFDEIVFNLERYNEFNQNSNR